jgi:hypothetical protein
VCWLRLIISLTLSLPSTLRPLYLSIPCSLVQSLSLTQLIHTVLSFSPSCLLPPLSLSLSLPHLLYLFLLYIFLLYIFLLFLLLLCLLLFYILLLTLSPLHNSAPVSVSLSPLSLALLVKHQPSIPKLLPRYPISLSLSPLPLYPSLFLSLFFTSLSLPPSSTLSLSIYLFISLLPIFFSLFLTQHSQIALPGSIFTKCFHN